MCPPPHKVLGGLARRTGGESPSVPSRVAKSGLFLLLGGRAAEGMVESPAGPWERKLCSLPEVSFCPLAQEHSPEVGVGIWGKGSLRETQEAASFWTLTVIVDQV